MGTKGFAKKVFDKVFRYDVVRLRGMDDMWKDKKPPEPLSYDTIEELVGEVDPLEPSRLNDQKVWDLEENFRVFIDRFVLNYGRLLVFY